jgi:hypothetical protein
MNIFRNRVIWKQVCLMLSSLSSFSIFWNIRGVQKCWKCDKVKNTENGKLACSPNCRNSFEQLGQNVKNPVNRTLRCSLGKSDYKMTVKWKELDKLAKLLNIKFTFWVGFGLSFSYKCY